MLGIFQADLPIGRRLWQIILASVISGTLASGKISFSERPIDFVVEVLLFYGYITAIHLFIMIIIVVLEKIFIYEQERRMNLTDYEYLIGVPVSNRWSLSFFNLSFLPAIFLALPNYGTETMSELGILGLTFVFLSEIINIDTLTYELKIIVELKKDKSKRLYARFVKPNHQDKYFVLSNDIIKEIVLLINCGWEPLDLSTSNVDSVAIFSKFDRESRLTFNQEKHKNLTQDEEKALLQNLIIHNNHWF